MNAEPLLSTEWHWFVILGTLISLAGVAWVLLANRQTSDKPTTGHVWDGIEELDTPLPMWWVGMFVASIVFSLIYLVIYPGMGNFDGVTDWSSAAQHDAEAQAHEAKFAPLYSSLASLPKEELQSNRTAMQVGRRLFINNCSTCHGVSASGSFGYPNLTDSQWLWGGDVATIKTTLLQGRMGIMPGWGPALGEAGVMQVTHYVLQLAGQTHDAELATSGAPQYAAICASCHAADGTGNPLLGAPDLTNNIWQYGGSVEQIYFTIDNGRTGVMPAFAELLGEDRVHILANYVETLSK
ncbi:MAG: cytochrome-c oxidase, cbb3-type subunit III [Pseudomonadota bacterium]